MKRKKLLLVYPALSSFVQTDREILSEVYEVTGCHFRPVRGALATLAGLAGQFLFLALNIWRFDVVWIWFADQHSILPVAAARLAGKKCFVVNGGYDVCRIRELGYGVFCSTPRGLAALWSMKLCTLNLPVSDHVARKVRAITGRTNIRRIYNAVNFTPGSPEPGPARHTILTVGLIDSERTLSVKGTDLFMETARLLPHLTFVAVGIDNAMATALRDRCPPNLKVYPPAGQQELRQHYNQALIYCQLSRTESFGLALAEAVLHGCIPLITPVGGMTEIIADKGYHVPPDPREIAGKISDIAGGAMKPTGELSRKILRTFQVENRRKAILAIAGADS